MCVDCTPDQHGLGPAGRRGNAPPHHAKAVPRRAAGRSAFTLVELLVVIAIIGVLLAMLLPAVQAAREAARRSACQSNLRQLALAVSGYESANKCFPPGQCAGIKYGFCEDSHAWSWLARILPYIEQSVLYEQGGIPDKTLRDSGVADRQLPEFLCPSDNYSQQGPRIDAGNLPGFPVGQTNYKGVSGANWGADESQNTDHIGTLWPNKGTNGSYDGHAHGDGLMWRNDILFKIRARHVTDGLSHTFMIGEDLPEKNCWCSWPYANNAYGTCAIPPNYNEADPIWWPDTHSFRSSHPGGLYFAFADGSVKFIEDSISKEAYRGLATRAGKEVVDGY